MQSSRLHCTTSISHEPYEIPLLVDKPARQSTHCYVERAGNEENYYSYVRKKVNTHRPLCTNKKSTLGN